MEQTIELRSSSSRHDGFAASVHRFARSTAQRILLRSKFARGQRFAGQCPDSMSRQTDATALMTEVHEALDTAEDQVIFGGVILVNAEQIGTLPRRDVARIHSGPLPEMEYFRWPFSAMARVAIRVVRKLTSPFTKKQERFNLDLLDTLRRLDDRLESQQHMIRQLRQRVVELEERLRSWE